MTIKKGQRISPATEFKKGESRGYRYPVGHRPDNPIKPGERRGVATEFEKGHIPKNKLPVGSVTIRQHKGDHPRAWIKVSEPNVWMPRAVHVWISSGGTVPKGFVIHHDNEDTLDDRIENLKCIKRGAHRMIHHEKIRLAQTGRTATIKTKTCQTCGIEYSGKPQSQFCEPCRKERTRAKRRDYKKRLRSQNR